MKHNMIFWVIAVLSLCLTKSFAQENLQSIEEHSENQIEFQPLLNESENQNEIVVEDELSEDSAEKSEIFDEETEVNLDASENFEEIEQTDIPSEFPPYENVTHIESEGISLEDEIFTEENLIISEIEPQSLDASEQPLPAVDLELPKIQVLCSSINGKKPNEIERLVLKKKKTPVSFYGIVSDAESGVAKISFSVGENEIAAESMLFAPVSAEQLPFKSVRNFRKWLKTAEFSAFPIENYETFVWRMDFFAENLQSGLGSFTASDKAENIQKSVPVSITVKGKTYVWIFVILCILVVIACVYLATNGFSEFEAANIGKAIVAGVVSVCVLIFLRLCILWLIPYISRAFLYGGIGVLCLAIAVIPFLWFWFIKKMTRPAVISATLGLVYIGVAIYLYAEKNCNLWWICFIGLVFDVILIILFSLCIWAERTVPEFIKKCKRTAIDQKEAKDIRTQQQQIAIKAEEQAQADEVLRKQKSARSLMESLKGNVEMLEDCVRQGQFQNDVLREVKHSAEELEQYRQFVRREHNLTQIIRTLKRIDKKIRKEKSLGADDFAKEEIKDVIKLLRRIDK